MNPTTTEFGYPATLIKEYEHWVVLLRPKQVTIGTLIIASKSNVTTLGQLTSKEWSEFSAVSNEIESVLKKVFTAEKFNYLALMMKDPNPHFHMVPRYSKSVQFNGREYKDTDWPLKTELTSIEMTQEDFVELLALLKSNITT